MAFVRSLGARVTVLHEGAVLAEGSVDHVQNHPRVIEVISGAETVLSVEGIDLYYGASHALRRVSIIRRKRAK